MLGAARPAPAAYHGPSRRGALVLGSVALALALVSGYLALRTDQASDQVSDAFRPGSTWDAAGMAAQRRGQLSYELEVATAAGALVAGGIAGWLALRR
jgi:hypothetical protein